MFIRVNIHSIQDNPFQSRQTLTGINELAESIRSLQAARPETSGLLQVPPARLYDVAANQYLPIRNVEANEVPELVHGELVHVQLAAGHRRLAAFKLLADQDSEYVTFPVEIQDLTDEQMADIAWTENAQREDVNPLEQAFALQKAMKRFGWTQEQVGRRWGLSRSAVANKIRLLQLPEDAQEALRTGQITERHGRVLLSAAAKSPEIYHDVASAVIAKPVEEQALATAREILESQHGSVVTNITVAYDNDKHCNACNRRLTGGNNARLYHNSEWVYLCPDCYRAGASDWEPPTVAELEDVYESTLRYSSRSFNDMRYFPPEEPISGEGIHSELCAGCQYNEKDRCYLESCFQRKTEQYEQDQLTELFERLREDFPEREEWIFHDGGYGVYEMQARHTTDCELIDNKCFACEKCLLRRYPYDVGDWYHRVYDDLPYVWLCKHTATHDACVRRWEEEHAPQESAREVQARLEKERALAYARQLFDRAAADVAQALLAGDNAKVWRAMVDEMGTPLDGRPSGNTPADLVAYYTRAIGMRILRASNVLELLETECTSIEATELVLKERLMKLHMEYPRFTDDIVRKLERMEHWLLQDGQLRADLTPVQVTGNIENVEELRCQVLEMANDGRLDDVNYHLLEDRLLHLLDQLVIVSQETPAPA